MILITNVCKSFLFYYVHNFSWLLTDSQVSQSVEAASQFRTNPKHKKLVSFVLALKEEEEEKKERFFYYVQ